MTPHPCHAQPEFQGWLEKQGYSHVRQLPSGEWIGVSPFLYTAGLCIGLDETGYRVRFCYANSRAAEDAADLYDGVGDPPGLWIKEKGGSERLGPGAFQ